MGTVRDYRNAIPGVIFALTPFYGLYSIGYIPHSTASFASSTSEGQTVKLAAALIASALVADVIGYPFALLVGISNYHVWNKYAIPVDEKIRSKVECCFNLAGIQE